MDTRVNSSLDIAKDGQITSPAVRAFRTTPWKHDRHLRARVLNAMADRFGERREEPIDLLALDNGKAKPEAAFEADFVSPGLRLTFGIFDAFRNAGRQAVEKTDVRVQASEVNGPMPITLAAGARP